jgi:hypothetical protein
VARRLADLSDRELAPLLNMTIPQVRRYRQPSTGPFSEAFAKIMSEEELADSERREEWFWNLTVEEFRALRESNIPEVEKPYVADVPVDVAGRHRAVQDLLQDQGEFETRYPAAHEILFPRAARRREHRGLYLPSFEARILNDWVHLHTFGQSSTNGADAHTSVSRWWRKDWRLHQANRHIDALGYDDLQGILLAILAREESGERVDAFLPRYRSGDVEGVQDPGELPIRLTDLRLVELLPLDRFEYGIRPILDLLHSPLSAEHVVLWKLRVLGSELEHRTAFSESVARYLMRIPKYQLPDDVAGYVEELREFEARKDEPNFRWTLLQPVKTQTDLLARQFGNEENGIAAVSFTAAALWLFLDLDMPDIEKARSYRLAEQVASLASIIRKLTQRLTRSTEDLSKLIANRSSGNRAELPGNNHEALQQYRLGRLDLRQTAEWLGITPYSSKTGKGTRDWKARVSQRLREGKQFEDSNYPRAAAIFANRDHPAVRRKARRAYRGYVIEMGRYGRCDFNTLGYYARTNAKSTKRSMEIAYAHLQLGSCIIQGIPPIP